MNKLREGEITMAEHLVDWSCYDQFFARKGRTTTNVSLSEAERREIEHLAARIVKLDEHNSSPWGIACPPGRTAQTVIGEISLEFVHDLTIKGKATNLGVEALGVKIFKDNTEALKKGPEVIAFQNSRVLSGFLQGSPCIQKSLDAGWAEDLHGRKRAYVVQQYVKGKTIEELHEEWTDTPAESQLVKTILEALWCQLAVRLWAEATNESQMVWDWRDGQFVVNGTDEYAVVTMIDSDCLRGLRKKADLRSLQRSRQENTALRRLCAMTTRLLKAQEKVFPEGWLKRRIADLLKESDLAVYHKANVPDGLLHELGVIISPAPCEIQKVASAALKFIALLKRERLISD